MQVILSESITALGQIGDVVNVAPGYARNYLFPKGLAMKAVSRNVRELEHRKRMLAQKREKVRQEMMSLAEKINAVTVMLRRKVSEDDKLYGSVSASDIFSVLEEQSLPVLRRSIQLDQPIKTLGEFTVPIRLDAQISAAIKVVVEREE